MYYSSKWSTEWFQEFLSCDVSMILRTLILSIHRPHGIWICRSGHFTRSYSYDLITGICSNILGTLGTLTVSGRGFFPDWISRIYVFRVSSIHRFKAVLYSNVKQSVHSAGLPTSLFKIQFDRFKWSRPQSVLVTASVPRAQWVTNLSFISTIKLPLSNYYHHQLSGQNARLFILEPTQAGRQVGQLAALHAP